MVLAFGPRSRFAALVCVFRRLVSFFGLWFPFLLGQNHLRFVICGMCLRFVPLVAGLRFLRVSCVRGRHFRSVEVACGFGFACFDF